MRATVCGVLVIVLLLVGSSVVAQGSWTARLRVIPENLALKAKLVFRARGGPTGEMTDLQFELQNLADEPMTINWDQSSLQLPSLGRQAVRPADSSGTDTPTTTVPAGSRATVRLCPIQSPPGPCGSAWLRRAMLVEDFSLTLSLTVETPQGVRTAEWRWDFDYHEEAAPVDPDPPDRSLSFIVLAAAVVIFALLLLR